jgi:hypothetical protein
MALFCAAAGTLEIARTKAQMQQTNKRFFILGSFLSVFSFLGPWMFTAKLYQRRFF